MNTTEEMVRIVQAGEYDLSGTTNNIEVNLDISTEMFFRFVVKDKNQVLQSVRYTIDGETYDTTADPYGECVLDIENKNVLESISIVLGAATDDNIAYLIAMYHYDTSKDKFYSHELSQFPEQIIELHNFKDLASEETPASVLAIVAEIKEKVAEGLYTEAAQILRENKDVLRPYYIDADIINFLDEEIRNLEIYTKIRKQSFYYQKFVPFAVVGDVWVNRDDGDVKGTEEIPITFDHEGLLPWVEDWTPDPLVVVPSDPPEILWG